MQLGPHGSAFHSFIVGTVTLDFTPATVASGATHSEDVDIPLGDLTDYFQLDATDLVIL